MRRGAVLPAIAVLVAVASASLPLLPDGLRRAAQHDHRHRGGSRPDRRRAAGPTTSRRPKSSSQNPIARRRARTGHAGAQRGIAAGRPGGRSTTSFWSMRSISAFPGLLLFLSLLVAQLRTARRVERRGLTIGRGARRQRVRGRRRRSRSSAFAVAAFFHPIAYQFYFFCIAGLAVALKNVCRTKRRRCAPGERPMNLARDCRDVDGSRRHRRFDC